MMPEKGFNLKSNDLMVVPVPIRKTINALKWERFCNAHSLLDDELVQEFYASLTIQMRLRLVEKVHELNQVIATGEEESDEEPNSLKPVERFENPEPRVEPEELVKLSVEPEYTTPMPIFASTSRKSELSILVDMCKFMHNQQQT
ncbi:hypothetical protein PVK06_030704 [Gossypium arboreum]|uniref:Uncharacterized protein n=1 Tax=Gossypium arboreum TaxID=29729 RepID=A0ABR0NRB3_GOSAR|nr:hypothetical protein PVK06_030704 [Gossypium arboreum]